MKKNERISNCRKVAESRARFPYRFPSVASVISVVNVVSIITLAPADLSAQESPPDTLFELEEIVVSATRTPMQVEALPAAITVITGEELERRGAHHVADALRVVPSLHVVRTGPPGGTTSLFLRGGESDHVQVLVDGVPINQPGGALDLATLSTDNVARIEVVRGPASVLYGSDAVTGIIQIFTRTGSGPPAGDFAVAAGNRGTLDVQAALSGGDDTAAWSISGGRFRTDGVYELNNEYRNDVASGALRLRLTERTDARLAVRWSDNAYHFPTNGAGEVVDENAFQTGERLTWSADLGHELGARVEARLLLGGARLDGGTDDDPDSPTDTLGAYASRQSSEIVRRFADLRANVRVGDASLLTLGAELERQSESAEGESITQFGTFPNAFEAKRETRGYYAQLLAALGPARLTGGARLEDGETFGTQWTWRVGATSPLGRLVRLRFAAGTAFKEPTFFQTFATGFVRGNPDLRPEQSRSWEVGAELAADSAGEFLLGATWFDQEFTDLIDYTSSPPEEGAPNYFNVAAASARGLELTATLRPSERTRVVAAYTNLRTIVRDTAFSGGADAEFGEDLPLLRRPEHSGSLLLGWADAGASANITVLYVGERSDWDFATFPFQRITLDAYTRVDVAAAVPLGQIGEAPLTATLSVENLLDTDYHEVFNFRTPGRTVLVGGRLSL